MVEACQARSNHLTLSCLLISATNVSGPSIPLEITFQLNINSQYICGRVVNAVLKNISPVKIVVVVVYYQHSEMDWLLLVVCMGLGLAFVLVNILVGTFLVAMKYLRIHTHC